MFKSIVQSFYRTTSLLILNKLLWRYCTFGETYTGLLSVLVLVLKRTQFILVLIWFRPPFYQVLTGTRFDPVLELTWAQLRWCWLQSCQQSNLYCFYGWPSSLEIMLPILGYPSQWESKQYNYVPKDWPSTDQMDVSGWCWDTRTSLNPKLMAIHHMIPQKSLQQLCKNLRLLQDTHKDTGFSSCHNKVTALPLFAKGVGCESISSKVIGSRNHLR